MILRANGLEAYLPEFFRWARGNFQATMAPYLRRDGR